METYERVTLQLLVSSRPVLQDRQLDASVTGLLVSFSLSLFPHPLLSSSLLGTILGGEVGGCVPFSG